MNAAELKLRYMYVVCRIKSDYFKTIKLAGFVHNAVHNYWYQFTANYKSLYVYLTTELHRGVELWMFNGRVSLSI